jgi:DNA modification methylase
MERMSYYEDNAVTLHHGQAPVVSALLESGSVQTIVTSPPYFGLRDYDQEGQFGAEKTVEEYVENLVSLFRELRRVLADDGTLWINLGDSYGKAKQLIGVPWLVAFGLQKDGWILRSDIIWHKRNAMPESATDRPSKSHEYLFLLSKSEKYHFAGELIREPQSPETLADMARRKIMNNKGTHGTTRSDLARPRTDYVKADGLRNKRSVWEINTTAFAGAHFAVYPPELIRPCIIAGSRPGDTVLDPFSGSGTTGMVANQEGRKYIGIDLNSEYLDLSLKTRFSQPALDFGGAA